MTFENLTEYFEEYNAIRRPSDRKLICQAPFVSMNFEQNGNATACCYNRTHVLGKYPENSVNEIWNSSKINELRQAIKELNLDKGCSLCKTQLQSRNYRSMLTKNFDGLKVNGDEAAALGPRILEFEISNLCNLECIMCNGYFSSSIRKNREKLPPAKNPYDKKFVEQLKPFLKNVEWVKFLGGEPFLNPLYYQIWEEIARVNPSANVVITSNATIMNKKVKWVLENVKPMFVLSIDSMKKETYEKIRKNASFEQTMENLNIFLWYGRINGRTIDLAVCPMVFNWEEIPEIFNWGTENIVQVNLNTMINPPEMSLKYVGAEKLKQIISFYKSVKLKTWEDSFQDPPPWTKIISQNNNNIFRDFINQLEFWSRS